jgi:hypothetical protein
MRRSWRPTAVFGKPAAVVEFKPVDNLGRELAESGGTNHVSPTSAAI